MPGPPELIQLFQTSATTLGVSWARSTLSNGNITQYDVLLAEGVDHREVELRAILNVSTRGIQETVFEGLKAKQLYSVQLRAHTVDGPGNYSEAVTAQLG